MKAEILNQLTWQDVAEIYRMGWRTLRELDTCPDSKYPEWSNSWEDAYKEVLRRLKEDKA